MEKKIILNNNNTTKYKKLSEKDKKNIGCKYIQSSSTKERKNITFFGNYIKSNNLFLNSNANMNPKKKHYYTNSNISAYLNNNNNSAIIRNTNNNMGANLLAFVRIKATKDFSSFYLDKMQKSQ